jgi:predicted permease
VQTFIQDLRYSFRTLAKAPGYTAVAVLTLALGVGANAAIFSVLQAVILRDLPYHEPDRVAVLWTRNIRQNLPDGTSYLNFRDWRAESRQFQAMAAYVRPEFTRSTLGGADAARIQIGVVGEGFFELLGTPALLGRTFTTADFVASPRTVVISHALWQQRFAADATVIGRSVRLGDDTVEIVGVMPPGFELPTEEVQLWQPLVFGANEEAEGGARGSDGLVVLGRLAPAATLAGARAEMDVIAARLRTRHPTTNAAFGVTTDRLVDRVIGATTTQSLWLLFGSVAFVLLIACTNVANLTLSRASARRHEFSLRTSLGASTWRLARQVLTESLALAILAGGCGLLVAWLGTQALRLLAPGALPRAGSIHVDAGVVLFLLLTTVGAGLLAGLLPALQIATVRPAEVLRAAGPRAVGGRGGRRVHQGLVVAEITLAVVLMSGAGLLIRSFARVQSAPRGFDSSNVLLLQVDLPDSHDDTPAKRTAFFSEAARRVRALPGVVAVGAISDFFIHRQPDYRIALEGQPPSRADEPAPPLTEDFVVPGYFEAMRIPVVRGRTLVPGDLTPGAPSVVVINEEMARRYWPGQDPIGRRFKYGLDPGAARPWKTVVGVVADMRRQRLDAAAIPFMFQPGVTGNMDMVVRTAGDPERWRDAIRAEMRAFDPRVPPYGIVTVEQRLGRTVALRRLQTMLLLGLAAVALTLAMIGAYGVIHQSVTARTREIGVRIALGASASRVHRMVLAGGLAPAVAGLGLGLLGSLALSRTLATFLYDTSALDPLIYSSVAALLLMVAIAACLAPARRAARVDPMLALRGD